MSVSLHAPAALTPVPIQNYPDAGCCIGCELWAGVANSLPSPPSVHIVQCDRVGRAM